MPIPFLQRFQVNRKSTLTPTFWNSLMQEINTYFQRVEVLQTDVTELKTTSVDTMLARINEVIVPAADRINKIAELGFLAVPSETVVALAEGDTLDFLVDEGDQRELFIPGAFVAVTRLSTPDDYAVAHVQEWSKATGLLTIDIISAVGAAGPFSDWLIVSSPVIVTAQAQFRNQAQAAAVSAAAARDAADGSADAASSSAASALSSANNATARLDDINEIIAPSGGPTPTTGNVDGRLWYDGNAVRVFDASSSSYVPAVSASLGGMSFQSGTFPASPTGVVTIGGGFSSVMVFRDGALQRETDHYTVASPNVTFLSPVAGQKWFIWAYKANDATDYYTKTEANDLLLAKLNSASYTAADVLTKIKTVDGSGSGLDADTVDGIEAAALAKLAGPQSYSGQHTFANIVINGGTIAGLSSALSVSLGGTGAPDAAGARTNLGLGSAAVKVGPAGAILGDTDAQVVSNKTLQDSTVAFVDEANSAKRLFHQLSGLSTTRTWTAQDVDGTVALLNSAPFTTSPTMPTPTAGDNSTKGATTAFVQTAISAIVGAAPGALNALDELAAALGNNPNYATDIANLLAQKQPLDADLTSIAALTSAANKLAYATGAQTWALTDFSPFARSILDDADAGTARGTLGLVIGSNVQAYDADLAAIASLVSAANKLPYATGSGTWALSDLSAFGRSLIDDADAAAARTTLELKSAAAADVLGTVSQAAGVPTGAILEKKSFQHLDGSVWRSVKLADGTLIINAKKVKITRDSVSRCIATLDFSDLGSFVPAAGRGGLDYTVTANLSNNSDDSGPGSAASGCTPPISSILAPVSGNKTATTVQVACYRVAGATDFASGDTLVLDVQIIGSWF